MATLMALPDPSECRCKHTRYDARPNQHIGDGRSPVKSAYAKRCPPLSTPAKLNLWRKKPRMRCPFDPVGRLHLRGNVLGSGHYRRPLPPRVLIPDPVAPASPLRPSPSPDVSHRPKPCDPSHEIPPHAGPAPQRVIHPIQAAPAQTQGASNRPARSADTASPSKRRRQS